MQMRFVKTIDCNFFEKQTRNCDKISTSQNDIPGNIKGQMMT